MRGRFPSGALRLPSEFSSSLFVRRFGATRNIPRTLTPPRNEARPQNRRATRLVSSVSSALSRSTERLRPPRTGAPNNDIVPANYRMINASYIQQSGMVASKSLFFINGGCRNDVGPYVENEQTSYTPIPARRGCSSPPYRFPNTGRKEDTMNIDKQVTSAESKTEATTAQHPGSPEASQMDGSPPSLETASRDDVDKPWRKAALGYQNIDFTDDNGIEIPLLGSGD